MKPDTSIDFDPTPPPSITEGDRERVAVAVIQQWLDALGRAPTAEELYLFAEAYNSAR